MRLTPRKPQGRASRKALAFELEIRRLHVEGHTCEAIRQALSDAGLEVSRSTVHREIVKQTKRGVPYETRTAALSIVPRQAIAPPPTLNSPLAFASDPRSSKEIAESFVKGRITNPLFRSRSNHESSRH